MSGEHTHTQQLHFWVLSVLLEVFWFLFLQEKKKNTHVGSEHRKETNTITAAHLGGLMAALKSLGSGGVVMPPLAYKASVALRESDRPVN